MDSISVKAYSNNIKCDEKINFSILAIKTATAVDKTVSFQFNEKTSNIGDKHIFCEIKKIEVIQHNEEKAVTIMGSDSSIPEIDAGHEVILDPNDEEDFFNLDIDGNNSIEDEFYDKREVVIKGFETSEKITEKGGEIERESVEIKTNSIQLALVAKTIEDQGIKKNTDEQEIEKDLSDIHSNLIRVFVQNSEESEDIDVEFKIVKEELDKSKDELKDVYSFSFGSKGEILAGGNITEGGIPNFHITYNLLTGEAIVPKNCGVAIGTKVNINGVECTVRHETKEEQEEFEKSWIRFELALQRYTEHVESQIEKKEKKSDEKGDLKVRSLEDRVRVDYKSNISSILVDKFLDIIIKSDIRRVNLSNLLAKSIVDKHIKEDKIEKDEAENEEVKKINKKKTLNKEIIKSEADVKSLKTSFVYTSLDFKSVFDRPYIPLDSNHDLTRLPIKTENKKFNY
ncbi:MAG: hypothetical protein H0W50_07560 [Parachlamydiaceae bacterium]|nr:hypothetical protein [Parachlamydiaceae bacterium]